jgi:sortase A
MLAPSGSLFTRDSTNIKTGVAVILLAMLGGFKVWSLLVPLVLFGLVALPLVPQAETTSVALKTAEIENTGTLLSENGAELGSPPEDVRRAITGGGPGSMTLTVPKLGIQDLAIPEGSTQAELDREGIMHLSGTGLPWQEGSNTFIVGHALGFMRTKVPYVFYELDTMRPGDEIIIRDSAGETYAYRVYDMLTVRPADYWVTYPVDGKTVVSLQTCTPIPTFENRLIVRAELAG